MNLATEKSEGSTNSKNYSDVSDVEQRSSLPDIPLTNREKAELEKAMMMQNSQSSESVLQGIVPPPKPSKDRMPSAPPLPPKKKTSSVDDEPENFMQMLATNELRFDRKLDFDRFDEPDFNMSERGKSFSSVETSLIGSKSVKQIEATKSMTSTQFHNFNESNFSSMDLKECNINITSQEFNSRVFQTTSSDMHDLENSFNFMSINPNEFLMDQKMKSNENFSAIEQRPPLPIKMRSRSLRMEHHKSVYDNVDDVNRISLDAKASMTSSNSSLTSSLSARTENTSDSSHQIKVQRALQTLISLISKKSFSSRNWFQTSRRWLKVHHLSR